MRISISTTGHLYHITLVNRLDRIKLVGLETVRTGREDFYGKYSVGKLFLFEWEGLEYWWDYVERRVRDETDHPEDGWMPVCLRVPFPVDAEVDKLGSKDSGHDAYYVESPLEENIQVWDGSWKSLGRVSSKRMRKQVLNNSEYVESDGGYWDIYFEELMPERP
jgi:hypothetical protein